MCTHDINVDPLRDYLSGVYKIVTYYLAILIFFTIEVFVTSMIIINIIYWMVFSHSSGRPDVSDLRDK